MNGKITRLCQRITWRGGKGQIPKHEAMSTPELGTHERPPPLLKLGYLCARESCVCASHAGERDGSPPCPYRSLCRAAARVGGAGLAGLAHTPYDTQHTKYRKINTLAGRPPPLIQFHRGSKSSRRACTALPLDDPLPECSMHTLARRHTILRSRCQRVLL